VTISRALPLSLVALIVALLCAATWRGVKPGHAWVFPQDHWAHPEFRIEWWYFTGILEDVSSPGQLFGYQFTFFRVGLLPEEPDLDSRWATRQLLMGHAAVGEFGAGKHRFSDLLYREIPLLSGFGTYPDPRIAWSLAPAGTAGLWELSWNGEGFDFRMRDDERGMATSLSTHPQKPLVFQGPGGISRKGAEDEAASFYYSFTRLATHGKLTIGGRTRSVQGVSWMDHEFSSSQLQKDQVGWDWFALRLSDGRDLMLYVLRDSSGGADFCRGTLVSAAGETRFLTEGEWSIRSTGTWESPHTGCRYPSGWTLEVPAEDLKLEIVPILQDQENVCRRSANLHYWEGAVRLLATGRTPAGEGYVELTGYGRNNRPPL
jgi:predicted secreted hydrolase